MQLHHSLRPQLVAIALVTLLLVATVAPVAATGPQEPALSLAGSERIDSAAAAAFFDRELPASMERHGVPGGVVTVVHDGEVVLLRGYGHADLESGDPVDPHTTVFRTGSVAKVVTTTGVMQLAEAGTVDLDTDVTEYVDVEIPATYADPITLRHLATHTAGFDYVNDGVLTADPAAIPTVETVVKTELPPRVRAPGSASAYDNHGWALMGYVLEQQSGRSYSSYVHDEVFAPIGVSYHALKGVAFSMDSRSNCSGQ
jgi:CubicO group peptidase (beta-lactamase class C family)